VPLGLLAFFRADDPKGTYLVCSVRSPRTGRRLWFRWGMLRLPEGFMDLLDRLRPAEEVLKLLSAAVLDRWSVE
jgi:hypothetical protein